MKNKLVLVLRIITAVILLQTLYFKFTASSESVYIFSRLGLEPYGRIFAGISELIAAILLLIPSTFIFGAIASAGIISGAILSHLTVLGIEVQNDGGLLFLLALIVFLFSTGILIIEREKVIKLIQILLRKNSNQ